MVVRAYRLLVRPHLNLLYVIVNGVVSERTIFRSISESCGFCQSYIR
jgi:hypothetical protein